MWLFTQEPYNYKLEQLQLLQEVKLKDKHTKSEEIRQAKISQKQFKDKHEKFTEQQAKIINL